MKDFGAWFNSQGVTIEEWVETSSWLHCTGRGKPELVDREAFENGDSWYSEDPETGKGLCLGSHWCVP